MTATANEQPFFSVVTATFNSGAYLRRTAESLRRQTCTDFEWLVMDGGSSDGTRRVIEENADLIREWVSERDAGIADAWNKGIARARGRYVLILNAGDVYDPDFLAVMKASCDGRRIVCSHARVLREDGAIAGAFRSQPHKLSRAMHVAHNWCAVPKSSYDLLGPYRHLPLAMDFDWFHRYYKKYGADGFLVVDRALGAYYLGGKSDANYVQSFRMNERILIENGGSPLRARALCWSYSLKHACRRLLARTPP
jgi:glycosyltransferase involved in cell wall biosynthesis